MSLVSTKLDIKNKRLCWDILLLATDHSKRAIKISEDVHKPDPARTETLAKRGPNVHLCDVVSRLMPLHHITVKLCHGFTLSVKKLIAKSGITVFISTCF